MVWLFFSSRATVDSDVEESLVCHICRHHEPLVGAGGRHGHVTIELILPHLHNEHGLQDLVSASFFLWMPMYTQSSEWGTSWKSSLCDCDYTTIRFTALYSSGKIIYPCKVTSSMDEFTSICQWSTGTDVISCLWKLSPDGVNSDNDETQVQKTDVEDNKVCE
jgi:hypothetical protein